MLTTEMLLAIKAEIANDPTGRGYASAPDDNARAALFNTPYTIQVPQDQPNRISQVLTQAFAPNVIEASDITAALAS